MSVMGELGDFNVAGILQMLGFQRSTGRLLVNSEGDEVSLFLKNGQLVQVTSNRLSLRIGRVLEQLGLVEPQQLRAALREQAAQPGRSIGEVLIDRGWASAPEVARCFEEQCVLMMVRVMAADRGTFVYNSGDFATYHGSLNLSTDRILLEATRRVDELKELRSKLPDPKLPLAVSPRLDLHMIFLQTNDQRVVDALRAGATTIDHLADLLPYDEPTLLRTIISLYERGLVISGYGGRLSEISAPGGPVLGENDVLRLLPKVESFPERIVSD